MPSPHRIVAVAVLATFAAIGCDDTVGPSCPTDNHCSCEQDTSPCDLTCEPGATCSLACAETACALDCNGAASCDVTGGGGVTQLTVDCALGPCDVSCGAACTVTNCTGPGCIVTCGPGGPTVVGSTATCE